ncbi:hypothetical protein T492DRAFT_626031 [Pavlovales sp. CCMP2436]|nr:hypothetical protein T492DRAFT_626031 [Pavlovales sp. CCMP2436]
MDDDDSACPLCMEDLDVTDRNFRPCPCGYQVCLWCYHHIKESLSGQCPACRRPYEDAKITADPEEIAKLAGEKKKLDKQERRARSKDGAEARPKQVVLTREQLQNVRVIQRTLVYVVGLSPRVAREDHLRRPEFFGQYGRIIKIAVNTAQTYNAPSSYGQSLSCYITYGNKDEALNAILATDGVILDGRTLRAQFGTTKYCAHYIRHNTPCNNPECMFLHEIGDMVDTYSKEEMAGNGNRFHNETHPATSHKAMAVHAANGGRPQLHVKSLPQAMQPLLDAFNAPNTARNRQPQLASYGAPGAPSLVGGGGGSSSGLSAGGYAGHEAGAQADSLGSPSLGALPAPGGAGELEPGQALHQLWAEPPPEHAGAAAMGCQREVADLSSKGAAPVGSGALGGKVAASGAPGGAGGAIGPGGRAPGVAAGGGGGGSYPGGSPAQSRRQQPVESAYGGGAGAAPRRRALAGFNAEGQAALAAVMAANPAAFPAVSLLAGGRGLPPPTPLVTSGLRALASSLGGGGGGRGLLAIATRERTQLAAALRALLDRGEFWSAPFKDGADGGDDDEPNDPAAGVPPASRLFWALSGRRTDTHSFEGEGGKRDSEFEGERGGPEELPGGAWACDEANLGLGAGEEVHPRPAAAPGPSVDSHPNAHSGSGNSDEVEWHRNFRALLPNVNVSFRVGALPAAPALPEERGNGSGAGGGGKPPPGSEPGEDAPPPSSDSVAALWQQAAPLRPVGPEETIAMGPADEGKAGRWW